MGKRGAPVPPPSGNVVKCFCAVVVTAKRSVDKLFVRYFHNLSSASRGKKPPDSHRGSIPVPRWGTFVPRPLICPPLEKNLAGAHDNIYCLFITNVSLTWKVYRKRTLQAQLFWENDFPEAYHQQRRL